MTRVRTQPCEACPYRQDCPSGLWVVEEYAKLPPYDAETFAQPFQGFSCHATPDFYCHGWAVVHSNRGHAYELLALRIDHEAVVPDAAVPLWGSGLEAAEWGMRDIRRPKKAAKAMVNRLRKRYPRLKGLADNSG